MLVDVEGLPILRRDGVVHYALVDPEDFAWLNQWRWRILDDKHHYVCRAERHGHGQRRIFLHRLIMGLERGDKRVVDHMNGNPLDNRRSNLRVVTHAENAQNQGSRGGTSRHRGVSWDKRRGKWIAQANKLGVHHWLGYHETEDEAAAAVSAWLTEHMPFAIQKAAA